MKLILTAAFILFFKLHLLSQNMRGDVNNLVFQKVPNGFITQLPPALPLTEGNFFLHDEWRQANIYLNSQEMIENVSIKLNVKDFVLEINHNNQIKVLPGTKVEGFTWINENGIEEKYYNCKFYKPVNGKLQGFFQIVETGQFELLALTKTEVVSANYNAALDVGSKNNKIVKERTYYISNKGNVIEIISNRKKFATNFKENFRYDITDILLERDVNLKKENQLINFVSILNKS